VASIPDPPAPGGVHGPDEHRRDYEVGAPLREGWGGTLREGHYRRTGLRVTVQDIRAELTVTPGLVDRLAGIGLRSAAVRDPHVLAVYDLVAGEGVLQLIAEWSDAPTLAAWLKRREIHPGEVVVVVDGILAGLEALHGAGLFHGRIGAETVVVEPGGRARLAELAVCAAAAPPGAGPQTDLRAAARLGLELLRGLGRRAEPLRQALEPALDATAATDAAGLRAALAGAASAAFGGSRREGAAATDRPRRRRRRWIIGAAVALVVAGGGTAAGIILLGSPAPRAPAPSPLALGSDAGLTVTPASGGCNTTFVFVGHGSLSGTGTLVYRWEQSDGESSPPTSLSITSNEGAFQLTQAWRVQGAQTLDASMTLHILSPVNRTFKRPFHYACS
jgi:hypothetical protein